MPTLELTSLKHTHNVLYMMEKEDLEWIRALFTKVNLQHIARQSNISMIAFSQMTQCKRLLTSYLQSIFHSVKEHQPKCYFAMKRNPGLFLLRTHSYLRGWSLSLPNALWTQASAVGFSNLKLTPNMVSFLGKPHLLKTVALLPNREKQHPARLGW